MAKVELKKPVVEEIAGQIKEAESVVLVKYLGLTVEQDTALRKELREAGVAYKVYKNTMMNFAFQGTDCEELAKHLDGPNALAVSTDDATAPARILSKYAKEHDCFEMIAGIVEGKYCDSKELGALASIPSREVLLGKLLGSIQSPITNFARVLSQIAEQSGAADTATEEAAPAAEEAAPAAEEAAPAAEEAAPAAEEAAPAAEEAAPAAEEAAPATEKESTTEE